MKARDPIEAADPVQAACSAQWQAERADKSQYDSMAAAISAYLRAISPITMSPAAVKAFKDEYHKGSGDAALAFSRAMSVIAEALNPETQEKR